MTALQREIVDAHLLGDGGLYQYGNARHPYFNILRATADRAYLEWSYKHMGALVTGSGISDRSRINENGNELFLSRFQTARLSELDEFRSRWYAPDGQKRVPRDIKLTPLTMAI